MKPRVLVVLPALANPCDIGLFEKQLSFLTAYYVLDFLDPMHFDKMSYSSEDFYAGLRDFIGKNQKKYRAFIGFSLGALCLLQTLEEIDRSLIVLSAPTALSDLLKNKLQMSIRNLSGENYQQAYQLLMEWVHFPNEIKGVADISFESCRRLARGLEHACNWPFAQTYLQSSRQHWHFLGEKSQVVTRKDVAKPIGCEFVYVPDVGMRILENTSQNIEFKILECLK